MTGPMSLTDLTDEEKEELKVTFLDEQTTSGFDFDRPFMGWNDGKVFVYDTDLTKPRAFKDMLERDGKAASIEQLLTYPILAAKWEIKEAPGDNGEAKFIREFFEANEHNGGMKTPITNVIAQMTWAMTVRRVYFELIPTIRESDNKFVWSKISWCPPETCELALDDQTGDIEGFRQYPNTQYGYRNVLQNLNQLDKKTDEQQMIPVYGSRALVYIHGVWRDPIDGISSMQVAHWCHETKKRIFYLWTQFLDQTALPKQHVKHPTKAKQIAKQVAKLRGNDVIATDDETELANIESSGRGAQYFIEAIKWLDSEMSNSVLGGFMDLTSSAASGKGSFALSEDQSKLFLRTRRVVAIDMARQITNQVIAPLIRWNFGAKAAVPQFVFGPLSEANEDKVIDLFSTITQTTEAQKIPIEFLEMLSVRVANILEIDPVRVREGFDKMAKTYSDAADDDTSKLVAQVAGGVAAATAMVSNKNATAMGADPMSGVEDNDTSIPDPPELTDEEQAKQDEKESQQQNTSGSKSKSQSK